jgi:hypothetical protein
MSKKMTRAQAADFFRPLSRMKTTGSEYPANLPVSPVQGETGKVADTPPQEEAVTP